MEILEKAGFKLMIQEKWIFLTKSGESEKESTPAETEEIN
jgi:hypothetical protein